MGVNTVQIDHEALHKEADKVVRELPPEFAKQQPEPEPIPPADAEVMPPAELTFEDIEAIAQKHYRGPARLVVNRMCDWFAPGWRLTLDERSSLADGVALNAAAWWPDLQMPPKVTAAIALLMSVVSIVDARRDPDTGALPPRHLKPDEVPPAARAAPEAA